ncbi:MAG: 7-cyano-7-deazaguanine synthase [Patescibacteria group bacterium]
MDNSKKVLVLFSGGKDSSATVVEMIRAGYHVVLFTFQLGRPELIGPNGDSAPDIRHLELFKSFPQHIDAKRIILGNNFLIRKLAIEKTNSTHVVYPLAIALVFLSDAILYCLKNDIHDIACGYSAYQASEDRYIEQRDDFIEYTKDFLKEYGITFHVPVVKKNKEEVMAILDRCGVSSNSIESKAMLGAIPFDVEKTVEFWNASIPICREYIEDRMTLP